MHFPPALYRFTACSLLFYYWFTSSQMILRFMQYVFAFYKPNGLKSRLKWNTVVADKAEGSRWQREHLRHRGYSLLYQSALSRITMLLIHIKLQYYLNQWKHPLVWNKKWYDKTQIQMKTKAKILLEFNFCLLLLCFLNEGTFLYKDLLIPAWSLYPESCLLFGLHEENTLVRVSKTLVSVSCRVLL